MCVCVCVCVCVCACVCVFIYVYVNEKTFLPKNWVLKNSYQKHNNIRTTQ